MTGNATGGMERCAVCGDDAEIGGVPPNYYYPLDQSDVPDHKVNMSPNPQGLFACSYGCLEVYEEHGERALQTGTERSGNGGDSE